MQDIEEVSAERTAQLMRELMEDFPGADEGRAGLELVYPWSSTVIHSRYSLRPSVAQAREREPNGEGGG